MEQPPRELSIADKLQLWAGAILLETFAVATGADTIDMIENGNIQPFQMVVGALGTTALAISGAAMWRLAHGTQSSD